MSYPNYATQYISSDGFVRNFDDLSNIVSLVKTLDKQVENLSEEHKEMKQDIAAIESCNCDPNTISNLQQQIDSKVSCICNPEVINNIDNRLKSVENTIGEDEGENDTNLDDIMSK